MSPGDEGELPPLAEHVTRHCLACDSPEVAPAMVLTAEGALPHTPEHDFAYDHDVIVECGACGALRLETWRHDCFDFETFTDRTWYFPVEEDGAPDLRDAMEQCPAPLEEGCGCSVHTSLRGSLDALPPRNFRADRTQGVRAELRVERAAPGPWLRASEEP